MADQLRAGVVWANTFNKFDPTVAVRRLQGVRLRPRGRPARAGGLPARLRPPTHRAGIDVRKTYKLYIGGAFPRSRVRPLLRGHRRQGRLPRQRRAGLPQGRPGRRRRRPQGVRPAGPARTAYNRGQVLYRVAEMHGGPARRSSSTRSRAGEGLSPRKARGRRRRGHRPLGLVRRLGRQARPGPRRRQPGRRAVLQLLAARADRRRRRRSRRRTRRCSAWSACVAPAIVTGNTVVVRGVRRRGRCRRSPSPRCSPPPTCPAAWSTCSPAPRPRSRPWLASHMDVNAIDLTGVADAGAGRPSSRRRPPTTSSGCAAPPAPSRTGPPTRASARMTPFLETKTVWHPIGV